MTKNWLRKGLMVAAVVSAFAALLPPVTPAYAKGPSAAIEGVSFDPPPAPGRETVVSVTARYSCGFCASRFDPPDHADIEMPAAPASAPRVFRAPIVGSRRTPEGSLVVTYRAAVAIPEAFDGLPFFLVRLPPPPGARYNAEKGHWEVPVTLEGPRAPSWWMPWTEWPQGRPRLTRRFYFGPQYDVWARPEVRGLFDVEVRTWLGRFVAVARDPAPAELAAGTEGPVGVTISATPGILEAGIAAPEALAVAFVSMDSGESVRTVATKHPSSDGADWVYGTRVTFPYGGTWEARTWAVVEGRRVLLKSVWETRLEVAGPRWHCGVLRALPARC